MTKETKPVETHNKKVLNVNISKISFSELKQFELFIKQMKKDPNSRLFGIDKIKDPILWGMDNVKAGDHNGLFVAEQENKVIGFCNLFKKNNRVEVGIGILPEYRGKKIGTMLIKRLIEEAKKYGIKELYAGVKKGNIPAQRFFESHGFKKFESDEEAIIFKRGV